MVDSVESGQASPVDVEKPPSLWRNRDFVVLWGGQIVSTLGSRISATALPLLVLAVVGSPAAAGLVAAAGSLPFLLLNLPAGTLADRWPRRRLMIGSQIVAAVALSSVVVVVLSGAVTVPHLAVAAFVDGSCAVVYGVAEHAALPQIVPSVLLPAALAQNEAKGRGAALAGPPLGGLLFGLGRAVPFLADAVSYIVATVSVLTVRNELRPVRSAAPASMWRDTVTGLTFLYRHAFARTAVLLIAASNLIFQAILLILVVLATKQGADPAMIGLMFGIYGAGGLLGALVAGRLHRMFAPKTVVIGVNWVWAVLLPLLAVAHHPLLLGAIGAAAAFIGPMWNVVIGTYALTLIPDELRGRVTSAAMTVSAGAMPVGSLVAGLLLQGFGPVAGVLVLSAGMLLVAVAATASRAVRTVPPLEG
ncbi:MFS transporter [Dactylosporangium sp. NPDC048998]|uniref:MFS transporter n=1 Tax=Dactylosporangium sp. NPDC048998 TaxID=3363976 RepID=UPI0037226B90